MDQKTFKQLEQLIQKLLDKAMVNVATKDDLKAFATKDDLNNLVTKQYLDQALKKQREEIAEDTGDVINSLIQTIDERKANRDEVKKLDQRVTRIESKLAA